MSVRKLPKTFIDTKWHNSKHAHPDPPYLSKIPDPIEINIGRQLWVDDYLIQETKNIKRIFHQAVDVKKTPILPPIVYEQRSNSPLPDAVIYDPIKKEFKMWYVANYDYVPHRTCLAVSEDGINWVRRPFKNHKFQTYDPCCDKCPKYNAKMITGLPEKHNIIGSFGGCRNYHGRGSGSMIMDLKEKDPNKRFKFFWGGFRPMEIYFSPDGIEWTKAPKKGGWVGGSVWYASYNPFKKKYIFTFRDNLPHLCNARLSRYMETDDVLDAWPKWEDGHGRGFKVYKPEYPIPWCISDNLDINYTRRKPGVYCAHLVPYESIMINLICIYHSGDGFSKRCSVYPGFSRDGFHYNREMESRKPIIPETKDKYYIVPTGGNLLIVGERIYIYYIYKTSRSMFTGVSTLRRDGFVSLMPKDPEQESMVETKFLTTNSDAQYLFVNVNADQKIENQKIEDQKIEDQKGDGFLLAEILDGSNQVCLGFERKNCLGVKNLDTHKYHLKWKDSDKIPPKLKKFKIKFYLKNADFYSFWISPSHHGESNGYIGNGGPAYHSFQDTIKNYTNPLPESPVIKVPTDESLTRKAMVKMVKYQKPVNDPDNDPKVKRKNKKKAKKEAAARATAADGKQGNVEKNLVEKVEKGKLVEKIVEIKHPSGIVVPPPNEAALVKVKERKIVLGKDGMVRGESYTQIKFNYYDFYRYQKGMAEVSSEKNRKLNFQAVKILSPPSYENYSPRGGNLGPKSKNYGRTIKIKILDVFNHEQEVVLINNRKSNACITCIELA